MHQGLGESGGTVAGSAEGFSGFVALGVSAGEFEGGSVGVGGRLPGSGGGLSEGVVADGVVADGGVVKDSSLSGESGNPRDDGSNPCAAPIPEDAGAVGTPDDVSALISGPDSLYQRAASAQVKIQRRTSTAVIRVKMSPALTPKALCPPAPPKAPVKPPPLPL